MAAITLPESADELCLRFALTAREDEDKEYRNGPMNPLTENALSIGRPLNTALIVLAGYSGAGKSSLINVIFNDPGLCETSKYRSATTDPVMIKKSLCAVNENGNVHGSLALVDVPGSDDTNADKDKLHFVKIKKFLGRSPALASRTNLMEMMPNCKEIVHPNIVLLVLNSSDNRIIGDNSRLGTALKLLQEQGLVDFKNLNLIVVLTHAMLMGRVKTKFTRVLSEKTEMIREFVFSVLGISNVDIIPVENQGDDEDYELELIKGFYKLPNGDLSHHNLIMSMLKRFEKNNDHIGRLFVSWYLQQSCPEREQPPSIIRYDPQISDADLVEAGNIFRKLKPVSNTTPVYTFQSLGFGYDPVSENAKPVNLIKKAIDDNNLEMREVQVHESKFMIPSCIKDYTQSSSTFHRMSFSSKQEYESSRSTSYGLDVGVNLLVNVAADGNWVSNTSSSGRLGKFSLCHEIKVAKFTIEDPKQCIQNRRFLEELKGLPDVYNEVTAQAYLKFFSERGTHIIYEASIGGLLQADALLAESLFRESKMSEIEATLGLVMNSFGFGTPDGSLDRDAKIHHLNQIGISNVFLGFEGGKSPPGVFTIESLNNEIVSEWVKSVKMKPVELPRSFKLYPHYSLLEYGKQFRALEKATREYTGGKLKNFVQAQEVMSRDEISRSELAKLNKFIFLPVVFTAKLTYGIGRAVLQRNVERILHKKYGDNWMEVLGTNLDSILEELSGKTYGLAEFKNWIPEGDHFFMSEFLKFLESRLNDLITSAISRL